MRKEAPSPPPSSYAVCKFFLCFETKPLVASLTALTLVLLIWNLSPYYFNLISTTSSAASATEGCSVPGETSAVSTVSTSSVASLAAATDNSTAVSRKNDEDPNKRVFEPYGNAAALFVLMGAYRGGPATFAVVGLASKPIHVFGKPWFKCEWISNNGSSVRAKALKILPDWGYGRVYTVVVVNCTFESNPNSDNSGGKLVIDAYYGESPRKFERFTAIEEAAGSYNESKFHPPYEFEYLYCGSSLYGNLSANRIREWIAYHAWFFGPKSHFVFHDAGGLSPEVRAVLEPWVRAGRVTVQDIRDQDRYDGYYFSDLREKYLKIH